LISWRMTQQYDSLEENRRLTEIVEEHQPRSTQPNIAKNAFYTNQTKRGIYP
jgi:hypothetical protein